MGTFFVEFVGDLLVPCSIYVGNVQVDSGQTAWCYATSSFMVRGKHEGRSQVCRIRVRSVLRGLVHYFFYFMRAVAPISLKEVLMHMKLLFHVTACNRPVEDCRWESCCVARCL